MLTAQHVRDTSFQEGMRPKHFETVSDFCEDFIYIPKSWRKQETLSGALSGHLSPSSL